MKLTYKLITAKYKPIVVKFKLFKILLSQYSETYMLLMEYPSILGEEITDYTKIYTWKLFYTYIYAHSQRLIDECIGDVAQAISRLKS